MREKVSVQKLDRFMRELAKEATSAGSVFFTGGATALMLGLREQTIDVDLRFDPEPGGVFEAVARLKDSLNLNIELASPADFIPVGPDWKNASPFIRRDGQVDYYHFDLRAQILSKIERGYSQDLQDARAFLQAGNLSPEALRSHFLELKPRLIRYPAIDPDNFQKKLDTFLGTI